MLWRLQIGHDHCLTDLSYIRTSNPISSSTVLSVTEVCLQQYCQDVGLKEQQKIIRNKRVYLFINAVSSRDYMASSRKWLMNNQLERMWKEMWLYLRYWEIPFHSPVRTMVPQPKFQTGPKTASNRYIQLPQQKVNTVTMHVLMLYIGAGLRMCYTVQ